MNLILIFFLLPLSVAHSFDGRIEYEIEDTQKNIEGKQELKLGIKKHLMYFDMGKAIDNKFHSSMKVITNFNTKTFTILEKNSVRKEKFDTAYTDPSFIPPEETLSLKNKKNILNFETEEYETFYFSNKVRLPVNGWYASSLDMPLNKSVWHLNKFNEQLGFLNLLVHPVSKKIALELVINRSDKTKKIFKANKIKRDSLSDNDFETFSGEGYLHYIGFNSKAPDKKFYLTIALKSDVIRFNTSYKPNSNDFVRALVLDYNQNIFISRNRKQIDILLMYPDVANKKITAPNEVISTKKKKLIIGLPVDEFETSYVEDNKKLLVDIWYTPKLYLYYFSPVQNLYNIASDLGLNNLFIHPQTKQLALEITYKRANGSITTFKCVKWEKTSVPSNYFDLGGRTFR